MASADGEEREGGVVGDRGAGGEGRERGGQGAGRSAGEWRKQCQR